MDNCIFCKIVKGEIPSNKIYEDESVLAFLDIAPINRGHALVIPKKHFENIYDVPDEVLTDVIKVSKKIAKAVKKAVGADGVNVSMNNEPAAGQVVFHLYIHIIPRLITDGLKSWKSRGDYKQGEPEQVAEKII